MEKSSPREVSLFKVYIVKLLSYEMKPGSLAAKPVLLTHDALLFALAPPMPFLHFNLFIVLPCFIVFIQNLHFKINFLDFSGVHYYLNRAISKS